MEGEFTAREGVGKWGRERCIVSRGPSGGGEGEGRRGRWEGGCEACDGGGDARREAVALGWVILVCVCARVCR